MKTSNLFVFGTCVNESVMCGNDRAERERETDRHIDRDRETETDRLTTDIECMIPYPICRLDPIFTIICTSKSNQ